MTPLYTDSKGAKHVIADMHPAKLINALKAAQRDGWNIEKHETQEEHDEVLAALEAQDEVNRTAYIAELTVERETASPDRRDAIDAILAELNSAKS